MNTRMSGQLFCIAFSLLIGFMAAGESLNANSGQAQKVSLESDIKKLINENSQTLINETNWKKKWATLSGFKKSLFDFGVRNTSQIAPRERVNLIALSDYYLSALPPKSAFKKENCADYQQELLNDTKAISRKQFDYYAETAARIIDSFCR